MSSKSHVLQASKSRKIIVVGAGMSGLVAALELERAGHKVIVVEARDRVGGRVYTQRGQDGTPIAEAGAGRIPRSHRWTFDYIERVGLKTHPLYPAGFKNIAAIDGKRWPADPDVDLAEAISLPAQEQKLGFDGLVKSYLLENVAKVRSSGVLDTNAWPPENLAHLDRHSIIDYLQELGVSEGAIKLLTLGAFPTAISPLMLSRVLAHYDRSSLSIIEGGNDNLPKVIAGKLRGDILLNTPVRAIRQSSDNVEVTVSSAGRTATIAADALICTIPYSVLPGVSFDPPLSPEKQEILSEIRYIKASKVAFRTRTRFWENEGLSGFAQLDSAAEIWSPRWPSNGQRGVLQFYQQGDRSLELDAMGESERVHWAIRSIDQVFPGLEPQIQECVSYSWQLDPWVRGAYGIAQPGQLFRWKGKIAKPEGRLFFAGEHTSAEYSAWIEGAVRSGYRAAIEVNDALGPHPGTALHHD